MPLSKFEEDVFEKLIERSPLREHLAKQLKAASITKREYTGVGVFIYFRLPQDIQPLEEFTNFDLSQVTMEIEGLAHGAGAVLFVRNGFLDMLEFYTYTESWPDKIQNYRLSFVDSSNIIDTTGDRSIHRKH